MFSRHGAGPVLDTTQEPWRGTYPGLGSIWVAADGAYGIEPEPIAADDDADTLETRATALEAGWAELLSWRRRNHLLLYGLALSDDPARGCLLMLHAGTETSRVLLALCSQGWVVVADEPTPARLNGGRLWAQPRRSPVLAARRAVRDVDAPLLTARGDTDAVRIDVARHDRPIAVTAVALVERESVGATEVAPITGRDKLVIAARLRVGGVLDSRTDAPEEEKLLRGRCDLAFSLLVSELPMCRFTVRHRSPNGFDDETSRIIAWWKALDATGR